MFLSYFTLLVALSLSAVAAWYSIIGLTAIFAAAVIPIIIMGGILEVAKITITVWLHEYWNQARWLMKAYLVPAVVLLMIITSMGIFGFLSKAHLDQAVPTGDVQAQVALLDEKIQTQRDNIATARAAIQQMDNQVNERLARSEDDRGAERAVQIRRNQARERGALQREIAAAQAEIAALNQQRAPVAAELRKVEAEVGPIKYIAALIYGDDPDANLLEKAVRWVIILLVIVFDPLAIMMVLAATESLKWRRERAQSPPPAYEPDDGPLTDDQLAQLQQSADDYDPERANQLIAEIEPVVPETVLPEPEKSMLEQHPYLDKEFAHFENIPPMVAPEPEPVQPVTEIVEPEPVQPVAEIVEPDPLPESPTSKVDFGAHLPDSGQRGDQYVITGVMPTVLYKHNGHKWVGVDKNTSDSYAYNQAYIEYLVQKIATGEYDPEMLTDVERTQIEIHLRSE